MTHVPQDSAPRQPPPRIRVTAAGIARAAGVLMVLLGTLSGTSARAAVGDHLWSRGFPAGGQLAVDPSGGLLSAGTIFGPVDFGGGNLVPVNFLGGDVFIARHDGTGAHVWSAQFTPGGFGISAECVAAGAAGELIIGGSLQNGDVDFGGGVLTGAGHGYLAAFDASGNHLWSRTIGEGTPRGLAADAGRVVVTGNTTGSMDLGGGALAPTGGYDIFLAAYSPAGGHLWSTLYGDAADQGGMAVAVDGSGNVFLAASNFGTVDFGGGPLASAFGADLCLARFTAGGAHSWSATFAGNFTPGGGILLNVSVDASSAHGLVVAGETDGGVDFGGGSITAAGSFDMFVAVYDSVGGHRWSALYGGTSFDGAQGVSFDGAGNVAVAGTFLSATAGFGGGSFARGGFSSDFFAALYDPFGTHLWSASYTGNSQYLIDVACVGSSALMLSGGAAPGVDFGGGPLADAEYFQARLEGVSGSQSSVVGDVPSPVSGLLAAPNPFRVSTIVQFTLAETAATRVSVVDVQGRRVATLLDAELNAGSHQVVWDGRTTRGSGAAPGIYFVTVDTGAGGTVRKVARVH